MVFTKKDRSEVEDVAFMGAMPGRISHDMNQPLNAIKMISGGILYLLNQGKKLPDAELVDCMKEIVCQTDRIAGMVKQLKN